MSLRQITEEKGRGKELETVIVSMSVMQSVTVYCTVAERNEGFSHFYLRKKKRKWLTNFLWCRSWLFISNKIKKDEDQNEQHVTLRNSEEKVRGKELETVWDDVNG